MMLKFKTRGFIFYTALSLLTAAVAADHAHASVTECTLRQDPVEFITCIIKQARSILKNDDGEVSAEDKKQFSLMLNSYFDMDVIAGNILREYAGFSAQDKEAFKKYLSNNLINIYSTETKIKTFRNMSCYVEKRTTQQSGKTLVISRFYPAKTYPAKDGVLDKNPQGGNAKPTIVRWQIVKSSPMKITDVQIESFSQIHTLRSEYRAKYAKNKNFYKG